MKYSFGLASTALATMAMLPGLPAKAAPAGPAGPLQSFTVQDYLSHPWTDELIHFPFDVAAKSPQLTLTDTGGVPVPCQLSDIRRDAKTHRVSGNVWTVVSLAPDARADFQLRPGSPLNHTDLTLTTEAGALVLANDHLSIRLPLWPGIMKTAAPLAGLPAPIAAVRGATGDWMGSGAWIDEGNQHTVTQATTEVIERGPVRCGVRQHLIFADGHTYFLSIELGSHQEAATIDERTDLDAPSAGWRFSLAAGLGADHVFWQNQWKTTDQAKSWEQLNSTVNFAKENQVCALRPWSFWWKGNITEWAGFYRGGAEPLIGILTLRPSQWSPQGWDGFDRTAIPVTARPGNNLDLTFSFLATTQKVANANSAVVPLHREWAITVGKVSEHTQPPPTDPNAPPQVSKLRLELVKYGEFPLDEVKDYGFDYTPSVSTRKHPYLLFNQSDLDRIRSQVLRTPALLTQVEKARKYIRGSNAVAVLNKEGEAAFIKKCYYPNGLSAAIPEAFIGDANRDYARLMAAATREQLGHIKEQLLDRPFRPAIGAYGPWTAGNVLMAAIHFDLMADSGLLTPDEVTRDRHFLVFLEHWVTHPDYWDTTKGIASANPNMTSSIVLAQGMLALLLDGHPQSAHWLAAAESELRSEIKSNVSPGGAWIEDPGYQSVSLDAMFLLAQSIKSVTGRDFFTDPNYKAAMEYYGFLLTPPDRRFPPNATPEDAAPMVLPSIGDMFSGYITPFNGWMANSTAKSDPDFSARQQFFWKMQYRFASQTASGVNSGPFTMGTVNPDLPAAPPTDLARAFPGFGSVMRTSWTDPLATYVAHRTGPNLHHYHDDFNEIVLYAKGAPVCLDFGNCYQPVERSEAWYHNRVSFDAAPTTGRLTGSTGKIMDLVSLPATVDYSYGLSTGSGNQVDARHVLLIKSADPMGANYVVMRDATTDGQPHQQFYWNLWCLSKEPQIDGNTIHFPGQFHIDLDVHVLSPAHPQIVPDHFAWSQQIYIWGNFKEEQYGVHIQKDGSAEDYFTVLYPRLNAQVTGDVTSLGNGAGARIEHTEGTDVVLLTPGKPGSVDYGEMNLQGEIAFARRYANGDLRLATIAGHCTVRNRAWQLSSDGAVAIDIQGRSVTGESSGEAHDCTIGLPANSSVTNVELDGQPVPLAIVDGKLSLHLPERAHRFAFRVVPK